MANIWAVLSGIFPDIIFYALTLVVFLVGVIKCCRPVLRNASSLRRATELLREGAKAKLSRPVWSEANFLGKRLQPVWRAFLHSADMAAAGGVMTDVADFVHDDAIITDPGKASLADVVPGLCTSLGILGTFMGLSIGLNGLDVMEISSYVQLTSGIALAFNTSIVGIIASLIFNVFYRYAVGRARAAVDSFTAAFYVYGIAQPADPATQLLAFEREQTDALDRLADEMSNRLAGDMQRAISSAMGPMQRSMNDFLGAATRAQVEGMDEIVSRFLDRMNVVLDGELRHLSQALSESADGQISAQAKLHGIVDSIGDLTQRVVEVHGVSEQVIAKFASYVGDVSGAYQDISDTQAEAAAVLTQIGDSSSRQMKYLSALQEYQAKLQASFHDYTAWTDQFVNGLDARTDAQNAAFGRTAEEMRESSQMLSGAYKSFTESIELGLANALGLFEENLQNIMRQVNGTLKEIQSTMADMEGALKRTSKK